MQTRLDYLSEFLNTEVPIDPRVNLPLLTQGDPNPRYLALEIARLNAVSDNGLKYDAGLMAEIERSLVSKGGIMGHIPDYKLDSDFPIDDLHWVGVLRQGESLYGRAYVPPGEVRDYLTRLKAVGGKIATSIVVNFENKVTQRDGSYTLAAPKLTSVDLAPQSRAALQLSGQFLFEMEGLDMPSVMAKIPEGGNTVAFTADDYDAVMYCLNNNKKQAVRSEVVQMIEALLREKLPNRDHAKVTAAEMRRERSHLDESPAALTAAREQFGF